MGPNSSCSSSSRANNVRPSSKQLPLLQAMQLSVPAMTQAGQDSHRRLFPCSSLRAAAACTEVPSPSGPPRLHCRRGRLHNCDLLSVQPCVQWVVQGRGCAGIGCRAPVCEASGAASASLQEVVSGIASSRRLGQSSPDACVQAGVCCCLLGSHAGGVGMTRQGLLRGHTLGGRRHVLAGCESHKGCTVCSLERVLAGVMENIAPHSVGLLHCNQHDCSCVVGRVRVSTRLPGHLLAASMHAALACWHRP